jgi:beta-1,2-mannobiose phosphorylase / 1,2-beta-oligomannan phosphorylase
LLYKVNLWEQNRIGASWAPIEISPGEWLFPYHGKQDDKVGYTQSFMILKETANGFPIITHCPSKRLMYASEPWELGGDFAIPCLFTCSGVVLDDGHLLMGYGAADQKIGIAKVPFDYLVNF